jgi:hypothetical protein
MVSQFVPATAVWGIRLVQGGDEIPTLMPLTISARDCAVSKRRRRNAYHACFGKVDGQIKGFADLSFQSRGGDVLAKTINAGVKKGSTKKKVAFVNSLD